MTNDYSQKIIRQLFTKEDPFHVHKILGFIALTSFLYRIPKFGKQDMGFLSATRKDEESFSSSSSSSSNDGMMTFVTLFLHLCLNISSFEFHIPTKRILSDGGRIWPQYRFHSLLFSSRAIMCIALNVYYYNLHHHHQQQQLLLPHGNYLIVMGTMLMGDIASKYWVKYPSHSIRDLKAPTWIKYYFSVMQFFATSVSLVGIRRCSLHYYMLMVIQVTAFLLTLRRKNLVSHERNVILYALLLVGGFIMGIYETYLWDPSQELLWISAFMGSSAAILRIFVGMNKYVIWTMLHCINCYCFIPSIRGDDVGSLLLLNVIQIRWWSVLVSVIMVGGGIWKSSISSY